LKEGTTMMEQYFVMLGATKKDGKTLISNISKLQIVEVKQRALEMWSDWVQELNMYQKDGWTSGICQVFIPLVLNGRTVAVPDGDTIVEKRFGYQDELKEKVETENEYAITKKSKAKVRGSNKKRNLGRSK
jgi:hypothetical protein